MKERDTEMKRERECLEGDTGRKRERGRERKIGNRVIGRGRGREREGEREKSRVVKIKNIKKQNLLYGCFKKQSTQKISNQKMKLKERDKSIILQYVQCMHNNVHAYKVPGF